MRNFIWFSWCRVRNAYWRLLQRTKIGRPRPDLTDIMAETLRTRSSEIAENIAKNNALFERLKRMK